jgi:N-acetyl sugar amidotransferase
VITYCARCFYPSNAKPTIIFDDEGVCSGCRFHESRQEIDWRERERMLRELLHEYGGRARALGSQYDCIIPVSGGKDSHFQAHIVKVQYGLNPLLVTYNHGFNTPLGLRNLRNLVARFDCDLIRFTANLGAVRRIARHMVRKVGDLTWHYHAGIMTFPFQIAVKYRIPLIVWGEGSFAEPTGMFRLADMVEFTNWSRREHSMRGFEPEDLIGAESGITASDMTPYVFPSDDEIESLGVRGIYLNNFLVWDGLLQARHMVEQYGFETYPARRDRTFNLFAKTDDAANDVHDYMKFLKFGYGRATDDVAPEIRRGRLTREEGFALVREYDHVRPTTLDGFLRFLGMTEAEFEDALAPMRDPDAWRQDAHGRWQRRAMPQDDGAHPATDKARVEQVTDRALSQANARFFYVPGETERAAVTRAANALEEPFTIL